MDGFENFLDTYASFLDLTKAFDCVTHEILFEKLKFYNFHNGAVTLVKSYISEQQQYVYYNKKKSSQQHLFGVPQGSVLGPTLFLIYINDLVSAQGRAKTILFADDTTFFQSYHPSEVENVDLAETEINLQQWFLANRLFLNHSKS